MARYRDHKPLDQKKWSFDGLHPTQVPEGNHYKHLEPHKPGAPEIEPSKMMHDDDDDFDLAAVERERKREAYVAKLESERASHRRARDDAGRGARCDARGGASGCARRWRRSADALATARTRAAGATALEAKNALLRTRVRPIHWSPYDRVGVVNADP